MVSRYAYQLEGSVPMFTANAKLAMPTGRSPKSAEISISDLLRLRLWGGHHVAYFDCWVQFCHRDPGTTMSALKVSHSQNLADDTCS